MILLGHLKQIDSLLYGLNKLNVADFLNVHFDLMQDIYQPYKNAHDDSLYINKNFNNPLRVMKQIHKAMSKRISDISSSRNIEY